MKKVLEEMLVETATIRKELQKPRDVASDAGRDELWNIFFEIAIATAKLIAHIKDLEELRRSIVGICEKGNQHEDRD